MYGNVIGMSDAVFISVFSMAVVFIILLIISYVIDLTAFVIKILKGRE